METFSVVLFVFHRTQERAAVCEDPDEAMDMLTMLKALKKVRCHLTVVNHTADAAVMA